MNKKSQQSKVKSQWSKVNSQAGVGLIELMLAIAVFVIGSATVAHLFIGSRVAMNYNLDKQQAVLLAKQGIEEVRAVRNDNFNNINEGTFPATITLNGKDFKRTVVISFLSADEVGVDSTVEWTAVGRDETISFAEIITNW